MNNRDNEQNGKASVTIYDIAEQLGLHPSTVNRALNGNGRIGKDTRQRVIDAAAKLGYRPSIIARSLRNSKTKTIGVVIPILGESSLASMAHGIEQVAYARGYNVIVCTTECSHERELQYYDLLNERRVEGIITAPLSPRDPSEPFSELLELEDRGIPVVVMEQNIPEERVNKVVMDNFGSARELTRHLIDLGHTRIGYLHPGLPAWTFSGQDRVAGYKAALIEAGLDVDESLIKRLTKDDMNVRNELPINEALLSYLKLNKPSALFVHHDMLAIKVLQACFVAGIRVPEDLAIVGFDDILPAAYTIPPLTTIHQPSAEIGERSAEILFQRIEGKLKVNVHEKILGQLVVRESCGVRLHAGERAIDKRSVFK